MGVDVSSVYVHSAYVNLFGVMVLSTVGVRDQYIVNWRGDLLGGRCILSICAFSYM